MPPSVSVLTSEAKKLVWKALAAGTTDALTPRLVRQELEQKFALSAGTLDQNKYKEPLKVAIFAALEDDEASEIAESSKLDKKKLTKRTSQDVSQSEKPKPTTTPDNGESKEIKKDPSHKVKKGKKSAKSSELVPLSDVEPDGSPEPMTPSNLESPQAYKIRTEKHVLPPKKKRKIGHIGSEQEVETSNDQELIHRSEAKNDDLKSESEMSVLIDEEPGRKRKSKGKEKSSASKQAAREKKSRTKAPTTLGKDEETIKRLKSLVGACGVRKVWSKVFLDISSPSQQIRKLKEILSDLGMTGRMSMEQAKTIKEKRELAKELEDVQEFEKSVLEKGRGSRDQDVETSANANKSRSDSEDGASESEESQMPKRKPATARRSIMKFLDDQSDED